MINEQWFSKFLFSDGLKPGTGKYEDWQRGKKLIAAVICGFGRPELKGELTIWLSNYTGYKEVN